MEASSFNMLFSKFQLHCMKLLLNLSACKNLKNKVKVIFYLNKNDGYIQGKELRN